MSNYLYYRYYIISKEVTWWYKTISQIYIFIIKIPAMIIFIIEVKFHSFRLGRYIFSKNKTYSFQFSLLHVVDSTLSDRSLS